MAAIGVFCASSTRVDRRWLDLAYRVGSELGRRGHTLVSGGGRVGMMGTVATGARDAGARTLGVIPQVLVDLEVADTGADELVVTDGMADRKTMMIEKSDAFLVLPGGLGTLDELFEVWTTATLGLHRKPIVLLDADGFYTGLLGWLAGLAPARFADGAAVGTVRTATTVDRALDEIDRALDGTDRAPDPVTDPVVRHEELFNEGVRTGDFGPWLATFHADAVATFAGLPIGPFRGRDAIARAYLEHPPSSPMRVTGSTVDGDRITCRFVWSDAPATGGTFTITLRGDRLAALDVNLDAAPRI